MKTRSHKTHVSFAADQSWSNQFTFCSLRVSGQTNSGGEVHWTIFHPRDDQWANIDFRDGVCVQAQLWNHCRFYQILISFFFATCSAEAKSQEDLKLLAQVGGKIVTLEVQFTAPHLKSFLSDFVVLTGTSSSTKTLKSWVWANKTSIPRMLKISWLHCPVGEPLSVA